jgi:hypothetical protein
MASAMSMNAFKKVQNLYREVMAAKRESRKLKKHPNVREEYALGKHPTL